MTRVKSVAMIGMVLLCLTACGPAPYKLAESGPYHVGMRTIQLVDESRGGRQVSVTVWYPAVQPADSTSSAPTRDADPDREGAVLAENPIRPTMNLDRTCNTLH